MLEYEKKVMLSADEYHAIRALCRDLPTQTQTNYYFDTEDLSMNQKGITYRIRAKDGKYKATIKHHDAVHPECSVEEDLVEQTAFDPQVFNIFGLHYQGELVTQRVILHKNPYCEMVLDCNFYLGHTDFELEVEYSAESESKAQTLLKGVAEFLVTAKQLTEVDAFLDRVGQGKSKSQRFFHRKMEGLQ